MPAGLRPCQPSSWGLWPAEPRDTKLCCASHSSVVLAHCPKHHLLSASCLPGWSVCLLACCGCFPAQSSVGNVSKTWVRSPWPMDSTWDHSSHIGGPPAHGHRESPEDLAQPIRDANRLLLVGGALPAQGLDTWASFRFCPAAMTRAPVAASTQAAPIKRRPRLASERAFLVLMRTEEFLAFGGTEC